jgi:protease-4
MKTFFKIFFGSCLGVLVGLFLMVFVLSGMIGSFASKSSSKQQNKIENNSILHLNLEGEIKDRTYEVPFLNFSLTSSSSKSIGLFDLQKVIKHAKEDKKIKIILLNVDNASFGIAGMYQFISFIEDFKKSNKLVYLYSNGATQKTFLIGAFADKVYLNPIASCEFDGFVFENMFFTGLMEKVGVQPNIFYAGEFKSATEPFRLKENSPENELQLKELLNDVNEVYLEKLSKKINITKDSLQSLADNLKITQAIDAKKYGLVDDLKYEDELLDELKSKLGYKKEDALNFISYQNYKKSLPEVSEQTDNQIAVLFAEGDIIDGKSEAGSIAGETYLKHISEIAEKANNNEIKALVLRVNSGGGSAFASEQIWRALHQLQKKIPIVVSFGDVAASGGYYIACASNKIFAQDNTITGSIGVFGMLFNTQKLFNEKLGITTDEVKTSPYADYGNSTRTWTPTENAAMQRDIDAIYTLFKSRVATARKLSDTQVSDIAKGRIYSGQDAKAIGLIDEIGELDDAIKEAQKLAKLTKLNVEYYPKSKEGYEIFINTLFGDGEENALFKLFRTEISTYKEIEKLKIYKKPQARIPIIFKIY